MKTLLLLTLLLSLGAFSCPDRNEPLYIRELKRHYETVWGRPSGIVRWGRGPVHDLPAEFGVAVFPPRGKRSYWVYATVGMSLGEPDALELHLLSPRKADELIELLTVVAHYHRTGARLGLHHTVNFGRPWLPGSACDHGLISLPYLDGPRLEWLDAGGTKIRNLWLIPITRSERNYKRDHGVEALETLFEQTRFNYLDPGRKSVVGAPASQ